MKISVIIPFFNEVEYFKKCLYSLEQQSYENLEIILVSDGASEESKKIALQFSRQNQKIVLIDKNNAGAGAARNEGIRVSRGDIIMFLDADDYYASDAIQTVAEAFENFNTDIVRYDYLTVPSIINESANERCSNKSQSRTYLEDYLNAQIKLRKFSPLVWLYAIKRDFLIENNIQFPELRCYEDNYFIFSMLRCNGSICEIDNKLVLHTKHPRSMMGSNMNPEKYNALVENACLFMTVQTKNENIANLRTFFAVLPISILLSRFILNRDFRSIHVKYMKFLIINFYKFKPVGLELVLHILFRKLKNLLKKV